MISIFLKNIVKELYRALESDLNFVIKSLTKLKKSPLIVIFPKDCNDLKTLLEILYIMRILNTTFIFFSLI